MNRLVEIVLAAARRAWAWTQDHRRIGAAARALRAHWLASLAVASLAGLIIVVNPPRLLGILARILWQPVVLMLPVVLGMYVLRGVAWWATLRRIGVRVGLLRSLLVEFAGQVMIFMPTGDLARVALIRDVAGGERSAGQLTGTVAFQELLYMTIVGLGVLPRVLSSPDVALLVLIMTVTHAAVLTVIVSGRAYAWAVRTVERIRILRRFDRQLRELRPAFVALLSWRTLLPVALLSAVAATLSYLLFWLALEAVGVTHVSFVVAAFVLSLGHLLSGLSFLPGGVGAFEGLLTVLMVANGVPAAQGVAAGIVYRGFNDVLMAALGALASLPLRNAGQCSGRTPRRSRTRRSEPAGEGARARGGR